MAREKIIVASSRAVAASQTSFKAFSLGRDVTRCCAARMQRDSRARVSVHVEAARSLRTYIPMLYMSYVYVRINAHDATRDGVSAWNTVYARTIKRSTTVRVTVRSPRREWSLEARKRN